jgi:hypothetical protein
MSKVKNTRNKIKSRLEIIKKINDNPSVLSESLSDKYLSNSRNLTDPFGKKIDDFLEKRKTKNENNRDVLSELIDISENFLTSSKRTESSDRLFYRNKLKQHAIDSALKVLNESKEIISNNVKKIFFVGDGICGTNRTIPNDIEVLLEPKEFDFLNMLTISPQTSMGQIVYESNKPTNKEKVNLNIYNSFTDPNGYTLKSTYPDVDILLKMMWNNNSQQFLVSNFFDNQNDILKVEDFFNDYYSVVEMPDLQQVINNTMLLTLQGDGTETLTFNKSLNNLDRLLKKIFKVCGTSTKRDELINQSPVDLFDENDEDIEFFFNFEDVEGIDIDDENNRLRKVMKFTDCNNFETPVNTTMINDFVYLSTKNNLNDLINDTLSRTATDIHLRSDSDIPQTNFNISLINTFILNLPKAIIMSILSPKLILPIVLVYKIFNGNTGAFQDIKVLMKNLSKLFFNIIKDLYWLFIRTFWSLVKIDLLAFVSLLVQKILRNKYKRYILIITSLILILNKILESGIDNCEDLFNTILNTIDGALSSRSPFNIPGLLLSLSDTLPGYSQDRAYLNITERLEASGISMEPIFGEGNDLPTLIKSIIDGNTEEMDTNSFVKIVLKPSVLPGPTGGAVVPPGIITGVGKWN